MGIDNMIKDNVKKTIITFCLILLAYTTGCAEINFFEAPGEILKHPLGSDLVKVGMTEEEVVSLWGKPSQINVLEPTDEWQTPRKEWVYRGRYSKVPLEQGYLFKTKYVTFDGNNVVSVKDEDEYRKDKINLEKD